MDSFYKVDDRKGEDTELTCPQELGYIALYGRNKKYGESPGTVPKVDIDPKRG